MLHGRALTRTARRFLCTADSYRGPGGLSAREIMAKMHEVGARDAGLSAEKAKDVGRAAAERLATAGKPKASKAEAAIPRSELEALSAQELVALLVARGIEFGDCTQQAQLLERAILHLGAKEKARHHPAYSQRHPSAGRVGGMPVDRSRAKT